jgi:hypothetical protein
MIQYTNKILCIFENVIDVFEGGDETFFLFGLTTVTAFFFSS